MGFLRSIIRVGLLGTAFFAGYSLCQYLNQDPKYYIRRINEKVYLVDKEINAKLEIDQENFQLGSIRYRIIGLLRDPAYQSTLEQIIQNGAKK